MYTAKRSDERSRLRVPCVGASARASPTVSHPTGALSTVPAFQPPPALQAGLRRASPAPTYPPPSRARRHGDPPHGRVGDVVGGPRETRTKGAHSARAAPPSCAPAGLTIVRNGQLRMPPGAKPGSTGLLVAVMSGGDGDADDYLKLGATANREGIAVLYPTGRAGSMWQIAQRFGSTDVELVIDLLDRVLASGCFDRRENLDHRRVQRRRLRTRKWPAWQPDAVRGRGRGRRGLPRPGSMPRRVLEHRSWRFTAARTPSSPSTVARRTTRATCCGTRAIGPGGTVARRCHPATGRATT